MLIIASRKAKKKIQKWWNKEKETSNDISSLTPPSSLPLCKGNMRRRSERFGRLKEPRDDGWRAGSDTGTGTYYSR